MRPWRAFVWDCDLRDGQVCAKSRTSGILELKVGGGQALQESIAPLVTLTVPPYLRELPESVVESIPVESRIPELPFGQLSWRNFERLVFRLMCKNSDIVYCAPFGRSGQAQDGIDVYGRLSGGKHVCWQAKNRREVSKADIKKAVDDFLEGKWAASSERFVLCIRACLADTALQNMIEVQAARLLEEDIEFECVDRMQLSEKLRSHPEIVDDFFGRKWLVAFAGEEAEAMLNRPLEVQRVIALRKRLAEIYSARGQQLDPGLNADPARPDTRDVRKRFVVPEVDPANPFLEPSLEPENRPGDAPGRDDNAREFGEHGDPGKPYGFHGRSNEAPVTPSLGLDDWLLQGKRSLLLLGAPGSGKSTVLRSLALDLVLSPELFPSVHDRLGARIPLLVPFALWSRLAAREQREVSLAEVTREAFRALVPQRELEESFIEALSDERLVLLIDGLDEYGDEQAARTTLATIETFVRTRDVFAIATTRPAGLRRLGPLSGQWDTARLMELQPRQQRDLATRLLSEDDGAVTPVALRVEQFFQQLEHNGRLQSLAGTPLLLHGLLSVAARRIILPNTRFQLFQKLIEIMLEVHPNRRATAASEVTPRSRMFSIDDFRSEALAKLAFEVQVRGEDAGIDRGDARRVIEEFLGDAESGPAWSKREARLGARELTDIEADTSGLLVERGPEELAFCHAAFREHLAGLEIATWALEDQVNFVSSHASEPRWRGAILALIQSLKRRGDVDRMLEAIREEREGEPGLTDRRLLLAECAFSSAAVSGAVGRQAVLDSLSRIESGTDDIERFELLGLALDGPRAGPIGEAIVKHLARWWPGVVDLQSEFYAQLGQWQPTEELAQVLQLALHGDSNQLAASASLARAFGGNPEIGCRLTAMIHNSVNPWVTAAALDALSRGWPSVEGLDDWLSEGERSPSIQVRTVATLALYRRGRRGDLGRDSLLAALGASWNRFAASLDVEIMDALVEGWSEDGKLHDACWAGIGRSGPPKFDIRYEHANSMLMRLHREDPRVPHWIQEELETSDGFPFRTVLLHEASLEPILSDHVNVRTAVEAWFEDEKFSRFDHEAAQLAAMHRSEAAKRAMLAHVAEPGYSRFWPVWSLLRGWGMEDAEVAAALEPLPRLPPDERQHFAQHIPEIVESVDESFELLMEICDLPEVLRTDFVVRGFAALGNEMNEERAVSAVLPHVRRSSFAYMGEDRFITRFRSDPRVKAFALQRLRESWPPLTSMAEAYGSDPEVAPLILQRAAPLPTMFRRYIARRASQRFDDDALRQALQQCELETDEHAMVQATIGLSYAALATPGEAEARTEILNAQLNAAGPNFDARRVAAFGGLLALGRVDVFADAKEKHDGKALSINLTGAIKDYAPVLELTAERWEELESAMGESAVGRLNKWTNNPARFWEVCSPYLNRSSCLKTRFLEYCEDRSVVLKASGLLALSRLRPGSSLLLDCSKRVLSSKLDAQKQSPLDAAQSTVVASKILAAHFSEESSAVAAIIEASDSPRSYGGALVGLASRWPDHEIVVREYGSLQQGRPRHVLLDCADLWILSAQGTREQVANAFAQYVTRPESSPWDFPEDALDAFRARLEREPESEVALSRLALANDEPSVRASTVRLLASVQAIGSQELAGKLHAAECRRTGPPRFALDILTNRVRPARELMREALRMA